MRGIDVHLIKGNLLTTIVSETSSSRSRLCLQYIT